MDLKRISTALLLTAAAALSLGLLTASPPAYGDTPVPAAPSNLTAKAVSPTSVRLTWKNNAANQSGVVISRDGVESVDLQGATVSSYTWSGLSPSTQYAFWVASKIYGTPGNPTGYGNTQSAWVGPVYVTTAAPPPLVTCGLDFYGHQGTPPCNFAYNGHIFNSGGAVQLTDIGVTWTVPTIKCTYGQAALGAADSIWVGLFSADGTLAQIGVDNSCTLDHYAPAQQNTAWWEIANPIPKQYQSRSEYPVNAGDSISAGVGASGNGSYNLLMFDIRGGSLVWTLSLPEHISQTGYPDVGAHVIPQVERLALT